MLVVLALGLVLLGGLLRVRVDTSAESFLPASDPALAAVEEKARDFGGDPIIVMARFAKPGQFVADHEQLMSLFKAEGQLAKLSDVAAVYGPATVLNQVAGAAQNFLAQIAGRRDGLRQQAEQAARTAGQGPTEVAAAGSNAVMQFDLRYAPLLVRGLPVGLPTLKNSQFGHNVIFGDDGQARPNWRFLVPNPSTVVLLVGPRQDMDQASTQRLVSAVRATMNGAGLATTSMVVSGVPTVTAELASEVAHEGPLIGALVLVVVLLRFMLVPAAGSRWHRLRPLVASFLGSAVTLALFGWLNYPLSFAAVMLLPLLFGVGSSFPLYLAVLPNRGRVMVMSVASAMAFLALALSPLPFVRDLGVALAVGVLLTVAVGVALTKYWPVPHVVGPSLEPSQTGRKLSAGLVRCCAAIAAVAALGGWVALSDITVSSDPVSLARGLPALNDAKTIERTLGASGEISVRLSGPDTLSPAALNWAREAERVVDARFAQQLHPVVGVASIFGFLGPNATPQQIDGAANLVPPYLRSAIVRPDRKVALLVYGVKLQDLGAQQRMIDDVKAALPAPPKGYEVDLVGLPVAAARGYQLLLDDRYPANIAGIAIAGLVLALGLRRRRDAARAVAASVLATGWGLGAIWALGLALNPLTMALGSLVSVTGCEFVVLLAEARRKGSPWLRRSVMVACLTSLLGYWALLPSQLWLVREFGLVLGAVVVLSYLAAKLVIGLTPPRTVGEKAGADSDGPVAGKALGGGNDDRIVLEVRR